MTTSPPRILGIDPGLNVTGYGVIEFAGSNDMRVVEAGVIRGGSADAAAGKSDLGGRLLKLADGIREVIEMFHPDSMALEDLYSHYERPQTAILMGHARGVICLAAAESHIETCHYAATQIKKLITGNGRASKSQMQWAVAKQLNLPEVPEPPDVADALAVAICHAFLTKATANPLR